MNKKIEDFTDLEVYQLSIELSLSVYKIISKMPEHEKYGICDQLRRSSSSVGANIAEGFGRYHKKDFIKFLYNARGSLNETKHFLILGQKLDYINQEELLDLEHQIKNLGIKLNNLIKSIYRTIE